MSGSPQTPSTLAATKARVRTPLLNLAVLVALGFGASSALLLPDLLT
jgi:hypothetical protein